MFHISTVKLLQYTNAILHIRVLITILEGWTATQTNLINIFFLKNARKDFQRINFTYFLFLPQKSTPNVVAVVVVEAPQTSTAAITYKLTLKLNKYNQKCK